MQKCAGADLLLTKSNPCIPEELRLQSQASLLSSHTVNVTALICSVVGKVRAFTFSRKLKG